MLDQNKVYVIIGVDTETDVGSFTPFYEGVKHGVPKLLSMFDENGVRGTFFFTGEAAHKNPEIARMVANSTSEVGCHSLYHETIGDELFPLPDLKPLLPHEVFPRLELATKWVEEAAGVHPTSFRCPRLWGSTAVCNALEKLGYLCDCTYPMYFYRDKYAPYHPSAEDWTKSGDMKLVEVPNFADMVMESSDPWLERDRDQWPQFRTEGAEFVMNKVRGFVDFVRKKNLPPVVCLYIHPWEFIHCEKTYHFGEASVTPDEFITRNCGDVAYAEMDKLIKLLKDYGAEFVTAGELAQMM